LDNLMVTVKPSSTPDADPTSGSWSYETNPGIFMGASNGSIQLCVPNQFMLICFVLDSSFGRYKFSMPMVTRMNGCQDVDPKLVRWGPGVVSIPDAQMTLNNTAVASIRLTVITDAGIYLSSDPQVVNTGPQTGGSHMIVG
jgi:hypothetical protein